MAHYDLPPVGTELRLRHNRKDYRAKVVMRPENPDKRAVKYSGRYYATLTAAAMAIRGYSVNGWLAWRTADDKHLTKPRIAERYKRKREK